MNLETASRAASLFLEGKNNRSVRPLIRFFGGEPLLNFGLVKGLVARLGKKAKKADFNLTTNGLLLDKKIADYLKKFPNFEIIISSSYSKIFDDDEFIKNISRLPLMTVNINLLPDNMRQSKDLFSELRKKGFRRFNFLPAYYTDWSEKSISSLRDNFKVIEKEIKSHPDGIQVKNIKSFSPVPLFNMSPVIDPEGDVYFGNFFLDKRFSGWRKELKLGNIQNTNDWKSIVQFPLEFDFDFLFKRTFSRQILDSTRKVDRALSDFVDKISSL